MVSSLLVDALTNPKAVLEELFGSTHDVNAFPEKVTAFFSQIFSADDAFNEIDQLDVICRPETYKHHSLICFRAMVQDTSLSSELYLAKTAGGSCGGWGNHNSNSLDDGTSSTCVDYAYVKECTVVWAVSIPGESSWASKRTETQKIDKSFSPPNSHKFPIPGACHIGVQVKIYDKKLAESLKSTDLASFVGILSQEPYNSNDDLSSQVDVPTLHVLFIRNIPQTIVTRSYPSPYILSNPDIRGELINWIAAEGLAGDRVAAEWVLLSTLSRVQSRSPPIFPLSITLSNFPSPDPSSPSSIPALYHIFSSIFPMISYIPLTLNTLNTTSFAPQSRDEELHGGWLQLPKGSLCIITETGITEGSINEKGVMNLRTTQEMISNQIMEYRFPFSSFRFETDVVFIVISESRKSAFFQTDLNFHLNHAASTKYELYKPESEIVLPPHDRLEAFRQLVNGAKLGSTSISDVTAAFVQDEFVRERMAAKEENLLTKSDLITSEDLIRRMMLARLLALSLHKSEITAEIWKEAKDLDGKKHS